MKTKKTKFDFEEFISKYKMNNIDLFKSYLTEIWLDLRLRSDDMDLGINKHTFFSYYILPGIISDRVFNVLDTNKDGYLCISEFVNGMIQIFSGDYDNLVHFVFQLYDCDNDGEITKEDVRLILSYLPLGNDSSAHSFRFESYDFGYRAESQEEIKKYSDITFEGSEVLDEVDFRKIIADKCSEIFIYLVILLFDRKPFTNRSVDGSQLKNQLQQGLLVKTPSYDTLKRKLIASPSLNSKLNPSSTKKLAKSPMMQSIKVSHKFDVDNDINNKVTQSKQNLRLKEKKNLLQAFGKKPDIATAKPTTSIIEEKLEKTKHDSYTYDLDEVLKNSDIANIIQKKDNHDLRDVEISKDISISMSNVSIEMLPNLTHTASGNVEKKKASTVKENGELEKKFISLQNFGKNGFDFENDDEKDKFNSIDKLDRVKKKKGRNNLESFSKIFSSCTNIEKLQELTLVKKFEGEEQSILPAFRHGKNPRKFTKKSTEGRNDLIDSDSDEKSSDMSSQEFGYSDEECDGQESQQKDVLFESTLYRLTSTKKVKKYWCKLINKDLYYYKNKQDNFHKGIHNLSGIYIKRLNNLTLDGKTMYCFGLSIQSDIKSYLCETEEEVITWIESIKKVTKYEDLNDIYDIKKKLGQGKFGLVKLCIHRTTGREAAIKIIAKKEMSEKDYEQTRIEIEILKISQHPNIITLYDIFENQDYYYIIMEVCKGSDLYDYLYARNFQIDEGRAKEIVRKITSALHYLHSYGIVHRDLKPENIMMTDTSENAEVKLLDFGLSKMIGPKDKCTERYGTLCYVAPELLLGEPYDKRIDLWSLGIISYVLLTGCLPYNDENNENEVARQIIQCNVPYPNFYWKNKSPAAKNFVSKLLQKNPEKRMSIKEALEHPWLQDILQKK